MATLKEQSWKRLCSFTHTGYQQIDARLTSEGLGYGYSDSQIIDALTWADSLALMVVVAFANLTGNGAVANEVLTYMNRGLAQAQRTHDPASID